MSVYCSDHCANRYNLVLPTGQKIVPTIHETCCVNLEQTETVDCNIGIRGCKGYSFDPVHTGTWLEYRNIFMLLLKSRCDILTVSSNLYERF